MLEEELRTKNIDVQALNGSAGGWGVGNEFEWLKASGIMEARVVVLQIGTHDLFQDMNNGEAVGRNVNFPTTKPFSAIGEIVERYVWPRVMKIAREGVESMPSKAQYVRNEKIIDQMIELVQVSGGVALLLHTPDRSEAKIGHHTGREWLNLKDICRRRNVEFVDMIDVFSRSIAAGKTPYRDSVHPNPLGNRLMASELCAKIDAAWRGKNW